MSTTSPESPASGSSTSSTSSSSSSAKNTKDTKVETSSDNSFVHKDVLSDTLAALGPLQPTATDALGVERLVGPPIDNWEPAAVEPHPDAIAHREFVDGLIADRRDERLGLLANTDRVGDTAKSAIEANKAEAKA